MKALLSSLAEVLALLMSLFNVEDFWIYTVYKAEFKINQSVTYSKWQSLINPAQNQIENKEVLPSWVSVESYYLGSYLYHNLLSIPANETTEQLLFWVRVCVL